MPSSDPESRPVIDVFEAIRTLRSMRRLDTARPVSDEDLVTILEAAARAATGGNSQPVRWLVVRDPEVKARVGAIYKVEGYKVLEYYREAAQTDEAVSRMVKSSYHLADHMGEVPVMIIPCTQGSRPQESSVFPGIQNLMLAARALGLGTTLTTLHRNDEPAVLAALGLPEDVVTYAIIPVGYPLGRWGEGPRKPVRESVYWERWGELRP